MLRKDGRPYTTRNNYVLRERCYAALIIKKLRCNAQSRTNLRVFCIRLLISFTVLAS